MSAETRAGRQARTDREAPTDEKPGVTTACDVCSERDAEGVLPDGRDACRPCARRETVRDATPDPVDPRVGDTVLFESQGVECRGRVLRRSGSSITVEVRTPEEIVVEQVTEIVEDDDE